MRNRLLLLGSVSLTGPDDTLMRRATQQRRLGLLALIASSPDACTSRDRVLGLLWPDRPERSARHLLADSLYVLRQALGDTSIVATGDIVRLSPELVWTDVGAFRRALDEERWADALDLYRGDFLEGFHLRGAADFDLWALGERTRLRASAARAATAQIALLEREGRVADAVGIAERRFALEESDEPALRDLVRLLIATGNRAQAEAVARGFVERLAREWDMAPSAETLRFMKELKVSSVTEPVVVVVKHASPRRSTRATDSLTESIIAQARHHWRQRTRSSVERAIEYFGRATERDPRAVQAWCGLADSWIVMIGRGYAPLDYALARASASAERALTLDDTLSTVHASMGGVNIMRRNWREADASLRRALALDAQNSDARYWLAMVLLTAYGDHDGALREQTITARLDPVSAFQVGSLGWLRYLRGEYELSRSEMEPSADLNGDLEEAHAGVARVAARLGDVAGMRRAIQAGLTRRADLRGDLLAEQASAFAVLGDVRRATRLARAASAAGAMPLNAALAWASVGDADRAFEQLARETFLVYWTPQAAWLDPRFDAIRDDRRFARVRERVVRTWRPEWSA